MVSCFYVLEECVLSRLFGGLVCLFGGLIFAALELNFFGLESLWVRVWFGVHFVGLEAYSAGLGLTFACLDIALLV